MTEENNKRIPDRKLVTAVGGIIGYTEYICPICGATEIKEFDTGNPHYHHGGDGWCDKCNKQMKIVRNWI